MVAPVVVLMMTLVVLVGVGLLVALAVAIVTSAVRGRKDDPPSDDVQG